MSLSKIQRRTERRRNARKPVRVMVPILCQHADGHESRHQARLIDISSSGARLWLPVRLPGRTLVSFNNPALGVGGTGTVRYCNAAKGGYEVGLEVSNGTGWGDKNTDLHNLAAALNETKAATDPSATLSEMIDEKH